MDYPATSTDTGIDGVRRAYLRGTDDFIPDVLYLLPRCDEDVTIRRTLAETAQDFCRETGCFAYEKVVDLADTVTRYKLTVPWPADLLVVDGMRLFIVKPDGTEKFQTSFDQRQYSIEEPTETDGWWLVLNSPVNAGNSGDSYRVKLDMRLIPHFDELIGEQATALPDKWLSRWRRAVTAGAVAFLAGLNGKPWSDEQLADMQRRKYNDLRGEAWQKANQTKLKSGGTSAIYGIPWC